MKKKLCILITILIAVVFNSCSSLYMEYYIFSDIDDFEQIEEDYSEEITIEKYDSPEKDKNIKKLSYTDFYAAEYSCKEFEFEIFAYEFESKDIAKEYFKNATDRESENDESFLEWGGIGGSEIVVLDDERTYVVSTSVPKKTKEFLSQIFSIKIA